MGGFSLGSMQHSDLHRLRSPGKKVFFNTTERINEWMVRWEILKTRLGLVSQWQGRHQSTSTRTLHQAVIGQNLIIIWWTLSAFDKFPQQENLRPKTSALSICSPCFSSITYDSLFRPKRIDGGCQLDQLCSARRCCSRKVRVFGYFLERGWFWWKHNAHRLGLLLTLLLMTINLNNSATESIPPSGSLIFISLYKYNIICYAIVYLI